MHIRTLLILIFAEAFFCACAPPKRASFVIDKESVFTDSQKTALNKLYLAHEQKTTNEIVIYTTTGIEPEESIMMYGVKVGKELGVGKKIRTMEY